MNARLPPLNALRAFVVAARHLSFARAAEELHVTPAAISHQVKALEQYVGVRLFRRRNRAIELTEAARACLPKLREGFERLGEAAEQLRTHEGGDTLAVSVATSLATKWLMPRLYRFVTAHPEVDVRISASTRLIDVRRTRIAGGTEQIGPRLDEADICIRFGTGEYPGFSVVKLFPVSVAPVCSPRLADAEPALRRPEDLRNHVLIQDDTIFFDGTNVRLGPLAESRGCAGRGRLARASIQSCRAGAGGRGGRIGRGPVTHGAREIRPRGRPPGDAVRTELAAGLRLLHRFP